MLFNKDKIKDSFEKYFRYFVVFMAQILNNKKNMLITMYTIPSILILLLLLLHVIISFKCPFLFFQNLFFKVLSIFIFSFHFFISFNSILKDYSVSFIFNFMLRRIGLCLLLTSIFFYLS